MTLKNHKLIGAGNVHIPYNWTYADTSAREGASGFVASDEGKFARQTDNDSVWMLVTYTGPTWVEITGSGGGSGLPSTLVFWARKGSAGTINPGQPVYISAYNVGGGYNEVELADADNAAKMPAIGLAYEAIDNTAAARIVVFGTLGSQNTSSWVDNDPLFVSTTEGVLTNTKPTGVTSKIQKVGLVLYSHVSAGFIQVIGAGRTNDLPNIASGSVWKGDGDGYPQEVALDTEITNSTHAGLTNNPHSTTFTEVVAADSGTDITAAEAETLTDTSSADALHTHTSASITVTSSTATSASPITTTSLTDVLIPSMTVTPGAGTYLVFFSATAAHNRTGENVYGTIYANGVAQAHTERKVGGQSNNLGNLGSQCSVTVGAGQAIEARWRVSSNSGGGIGSCPGPRTLTLIRVS